MDHKRWSIRKVLFCQQRRGMILSEQWQVLVSTATCSVNQSGRCGVCFIRTCLLILSKVVESQTSDPTISNPSSGSDRGYMVSAQRESSNPHVRLH